MVKKVLIKDIAKMCNVEEIREDRHEECKKENSIIQNMTAMVNSKKTFLSAEQQKLCEVV